MNHQFLKMTWNQLHKIELFIDFWYFGCLNAVDRFCCVLFGNIQKNQSFFWAATVNRGNTAQAATDGLGSIGLSCLHRTSQQESTTPV